MLYNLLCDSHPNRFVSFQTSNPLRFQDTASAQMVPDQQTFHKAVDCSNGDYTLDAPGH